MSEHKMCCGHVWDSRDSPNELIVFLVCHYANKFAFRMKNFCDYNYYSNLKFNETFQICKAWITRLVELEFDECGKRIKIFHAKSNQLQCEIAKSAKCLIKIEARFEF